MYKDIKKLNEIVDSMLEDNYRLRKDINSSLLPPLYGLRKVLNPDFDKTHIRYIGLETQRKSLDDRLIGEGIDWEPYREHTLRLHEFVRNPAQYFQLDFKFKFFMFVLAQIEYRGYMRYIDRHLAKAKTEIDKLNKLYSILEAKIEKDKVKACEPKKKSLMVKMKQYFLCGLIKT